MELLDNYSIQQILGFTIVLAFAIKGCVNFYDWAYARLKQIFQKETDERCEKNQLDEKLNQLGEQLNQVMEAQDKLEQNIDNLQARIQVLTESDKDDINAFIVKEHHFFCYTRKWIDDYSLESVEKRYVHYKEEGGNSFVHTLMEELRALPKQPPTE